MKTHDLSFANRPKLLSAEIIAYNYKDIAFAPYGDYWRQMHKICVLELLSVRKVQSFRSICEQESWDLIESISTQRLKTINLSDKIFTMINTIVSWISVGSRRKDQDMLLELSREGMDLSGGF
ncbi:putative oxidoreductase [Helianthus debilis subsp. tardiflorus]